jgi:serine/threonine protein kinase
MPSSSSTDADVDKSQDVDDLLLSQAPICQSPELYSSQTTTEITSAADIWSFGMIFFILMTGYFPVDEVAQIQETIDEENQYTENRQMISQLIEKMNRMNLTNTNAISSILMNCFQLLPSLRSNAKDLDEKIRLAYGKASSVGPIRIQPSHVIQTFPLFYQTICLKMTIRHFNFIKEMNEKNKETTTTTTAGAMTSNNLSSTTHHNNASNSNLESFEKRKTKIWKKIIFAIMAANRFQRGNNTNNNNSNHNNSKGVSNNDDNLVNITTIAIDDKLVHRGRYTKIGKLLTTNEGSIYAGIMTATNTKIFMKNARMKSNHRHGRTDQETELELSILKILNNHPQIAKFYDCIDEYPNKFLIIERQDDGILSDLLNDDSFLMTERLLQSIAKNLLYSLHFIHSKQILMRGLSLFSVSMRRISEFELSLKIWNFQTAAFTDVSGFCQKPFPASFHSIVDPSFLAPELLQIISSSQLQQQQQEKGGAGGGGEKDFPREPYSFPVDFWSLGVLLYSLIEKRSPFTIGNANMVSDEIMSLQNGSRKLSFENKSISTEAQDVVRSFLTRSFLPAKTSDALRSWLGGEDCYPFPQTSISSFHPSSAYGKSSASTTSNTISSSSFPGNASAVKFPPMISASASLPVTAMPPAAPLPAAPAATTTTASNLSTGTTLKMPHTIKANDSPLDVQNAETKLKFFFEQFVDHQRYYVKYFQFVAACNQEDYDLADSLYEELIAIDPKGEDKIAYKDPAAFQAGMKECIVLVDQLDEYYKSPVHVTERVKAFSRRKELKADKEKFQEALARVTPGSSSSFSADVQV